MIRIEATTGLQYRERGILQRGGLPYVMILDTVSIGEDTAA